MADFHETGIAGEEKAVNYLINKGFKILERNWRASHFEVDIIARQDDMLIIVEVKSRKTNYFGEPEEFVKKAKQRNLIKAANWYVNQNHIDLEIRFDIISILFNQSNHKIYHIEDAFYPTI